MPMTRVSRIALALMAVLGTGMLGYAQQPLSIMVEGEGMTLEIAPDNGAFLRLADRASDMAAVASPVLAENFRLYLLTAPDAGPGLTILGKKQKLSGHEQTPAGVALWWDGPMVDEQGGNHDIAAVMTIAMDGPAARFSLKLDNRSQYKVAEASYPFIGGMIGLDGTSPEAKTSVVAPNMETKTFTRPFPEHAASYPGMNMAYVDIAGAAHKRGLYMGAHDTVARYKLFRFVEAAADGQSDVFAFLTHFPYTAPGQSFEGTPVVFQFHDGGWLEAGKGIYRPWFIKTFGLQTPENDWIRQQSIFQMIMIMLPEGNVNYTYKEIPQLARDGLKYGVTALQLAGWQRGGHDNGYPYYEPDLRLGTWEELETAIAECHRMGVKVFFFVNITVVNLDTEWYKTELKDCWSGSVTGGDYWVAGWGMGTLGSRMSHTVPLMGFYDTAFPAMHDGHLKYFKKLAEIGADGLHLDKTFPGNMNFNPGCALGPDQTVHEGAIRLVADITRECQAIHPDFRVSHECSWDRLMTFGAATWWAGNMSRAKEVFPEIVETIGLYQPYDYQTYNNAVLNGHTVMASPHHFNRSMDYPTWRGLASHIRDVEKVRRELAERVFYGEPAPADQAMRIEGTPPSGVTMKTWRGLTSGKSACVVVNNGAKAASFKVTEFPGQTSGKVKVYIPGEKTRTVTLPTMVEAGPERVVFVAAD